MKESLFENTPVLHYDPIAEASIEIKKLAANMEGTRYKPPKFAKFKRKIQNLKKKLL